MEQPRPNELLLQFQQSLDEEQQAVNAVLDDLAEKLGAARQSLRTCSGTIEKRKAAYDSFSQRAVEQLMSLQTQLENGVGPEVMKELEESRSRVVELEEQLAEVGSKVSVADSAAAEEREEATRLRNELATREEALSALEQELDAVKSALAERESDTSVLDKVSALEQVEATLRAERDEAQRQAQKAAAIAGDLEEELAELRHVVEGAQKELQAEVKTRETLTAEFGVLREQHLAAQRRLEDVMGTLEEARTEAAAWRMKAEAGVAREELERVLARLDEETERANGLDEQLRDERSRGTKSALATQLAEAVKEAEEAEAEIRKLRREIEQSKKSKPGSEPTSVPVVAAVTSPLDEPPTPKAQAPSEDDLTRIRRAAKEGGKKTIGDLLVVAGLLSRERVDEAVEEQRRHPNKHLGTILIELGFASPAAVGQALASQAGVDFIRFQDNTVDPAAAGLINSRLAQQHTCIPIGMDGTRIRLALTNPMDLVAIEDIERSSGREVDVVVGTTSDIQAAIEKYYWEPE